MAPYLICISIVSLGVALFLATMTDAPDPNVWSKTADKTEHGKDETYMKEQVIDQRGESPEPRLKRSTYAELKSMAAEVVEKMNEFHDFLLEAQLIETEDTEPADEGSEFFGTRAIDPESLERTDSSGSLDLFYDLEDPLLDEPTKPMNAGDRVKQTLDKLKQGGVKVTKDIAQQVRKLMDKIRSRRDPDADFDPSKPRKESFGSRAKKAFGNFGEKMKNFAKKMKNPFREFFSAKFQMIIDVRPLSFILNPNKKEESEKKESEKGESEKEGSEKGESEKGESEKDESDKEESEKEKSGKEKPRKSSSF